jgi:uncharacterized membrane protein YozB (DUF420 family)
MVDPVVAQVNLGIQLVILAVLFASLIMKNRRNYFLHGGTMTAAALLNAFSFILVMGPSLFGLEQLVVSQPQHVASLVTIIHASFGTIAEILAIWLVVSWRLRSSVKYCAMKRKTMKIVLILWLVALFSGILLHFLLYII